MRTVLAVAIGLACGIVAGAVAPSVPAMLDGRYQTTGTSVLFVPSSVNKSAPPRGLVLALPGLGGSGRPMAEALAPAAEAHRWLVLAPTPTYENANETLAQSDQRVDGELVRLVAAARGGLPPEDARIFVVGFSRGAQSAHRFALRHPDIVAAVASLSAGSYTMPTSDAPYPLGIGGFSIWNGGRPFDAVGMRRVRFLIGVGADDVTRDAVPAAWDAVGGTTRVERAGRFADALAAIAVPERLVVFPGVGHTLTAGMIAAAADHFAAEPER